MEMLQLKHSYLSYHLMPVHRLTWSLLMSWHVRYMENRRLKESLKLLTLHCWCRGIYLITNYQSICWWPSWFHFLVHNFTWMVSEMKLLGLPSLMRSRQLRMVKLPQSITLSWWKLISMERTRRVPSLLVHCSYLTLSTGITIFDDMLIIDLKTVICEWWMTFQMNLI